MNPYPSEQTWWPTFEADLAAIYAQAGRPTPDWAAFRWAARTAYDASWAEANASATLHLAEARQGLGLGGTVPGPLTPTAGTPAYPYPSETDWWPTFEARLEALYADAGYSTPDWAAFRWAARTAYDASWMNKDAAAAKHLGEARTALGLPPLPHPPVGPLPDLVVRGHCLQQADGTWWTLIQASDFNLLNRWQHGEDITDVLMQRQACGFNALRVWTAYDIPNIGTFLDLDYGRIPAFVALCAQYGLYVEFTAYTGINDPNHWPQLCEAARQSSPRPLLELVNELSENTNEPDPWGRVFTLADYARPDGVLASHGSNGSEHWPVEPYWDFADFHTNGAFEEQRKVGHNAWEIWPGPTITNETSRFDDVGMWRGDAASVLARSAFDSAAGGALLCAGSCFHSVGGKSSVLWDESAARIAALWAAGPRSVRLDYQDGRYNHPVELETPDLLRVYQRVYDDARGAETVEIHREPTAMVMARAAVDLREVPDAARRFLLAWFRDYLRYAPTHSAHDDDPRGIRR